MRWNTAPVMIENGCHGRPDPLWRLSARPARPDRARDDAPSAGQLAGAAAVDAAATAGDQWVARAAGRYCDLELARPALSEPQQLREERAVHTAAVRRARAQGTGRRYR